MLIWAKSADATGGSLTTVFCSGQNDPFYIFTSNGPIVSSFLQHETLCALAESLSRHEQLLRIKPNYLSGASVTPQLHISIAQVMFKLFSSKNKRDYRKQWNISWHQLCVCCVFFYKNKTNQWIHSMVHYLHVLFALIPDLHMSW